MKPMQTENPFAKRIIGFAMKVHGKLGPGFSERVNQNALVVECSRNGVEVEVFKEIKVFYEDVLVGEFVADMVVRDVASGEVLLIENKAVSMLIKSHSQQLVNYLNATDIDNCKFIYHLVLLKPILNDIILLKNFFYLFRPFSIA